MQDSISPLKLAQKLQEFWSPRVIAEVDDSYVKIARLQGRLAWHNHEHEDELFFVLAGSLRMEYEDRHVILNTGDLHVVPAGVMHNPVADEECLIMLVERKSTRHTGNVQTDKTRDISQQLRSLPGTGDWPGTGPAGP